MQARDFAVEEGKGKVLKVHERVAHSDIGEIERRTASADNIIHGVARVGMHSKRKRQESNNTHKHCAAGDDH
jgi:hypothetical protein